MSADVISTTGCPVGAMLPPGANIGWTSGGDSQGGNHDRAPKSHNGIGGGWVIYYA